MKTRVLVVDDSPLIRAVLEESQRYIPKSWPEWQCKDKGLPI